MASPTSSVRPAPTQSAVLALIPDADPIVAPHRAHLDGSASWGVPAHVTVLYPFLDPGDIDEEMLARLATAVATVTAFDLTFARTAWFGDQVLWLAPVLDQPLRNLTAALAAAFPGHPPYAGAFDDPMPHLTVGERRFGDLPALHLAEREITTALPIHARVERVHLLTGSQEANSWSILSELPLS